jgi:hypothetical protein
MRAPSLAKSWAAALPVPPAAPVIIATLSLRLVILVFLRVAGLQSPALVLWCRS